MQPGTEIPSVRMFKPMDFTTLVSLMAFPPISNAWNVAFIYRTDIDMAGNRMGGGMTGSKGPQARTPARGLCSKDKASAHGMPALPTKLNGGMLSYEGFVVDSAKTCKTTVCLFCVCLCVCVCGQTWREENKKNSDGKEKQQLKVT